MASKPYAIRISTEELAELRERAKEHGIELSTAFRQGAAMYLAASEKERAAYDAKASVASARSALEESVEKARATLKALDK